MTAVDLKISELTDGAPMQRTDVIAALRGGVNVRYTLGNLLGPLNKLDATSAPAANDDSNAGFDVGSRKFDAARGVSFVCRSAAVGAAKWIRMDNADFFGYVSGRSYHANLNGIIAGAAVTANSARGILLVAKEQVTTRQLGVRVSTAQSGANIQLAIYGSDPATLMPTTLRANTANMSVAATGPVMGDLISNVTLEPGLYWLMYLGDATTAVFTAYVANTQMAAILGGTPAQIMSNAATAMSYVAWNMTAGSWIDLTGVAPTAWGNSTAYAAITFTVA